MKQVLSLHPEIINLLHDQHFGYEYPGTFDCRVCPLAETETLEKAANSHGILVEELISHMYESIKKQNSNTSYD